MKRNRFLEFIGFRYVANHNSMEIHRLKTEHKNCHIEAMTNAGYCTALWADHLMFFKGYNGCRWCYKEKDNG